MGNLAYMTIIMTTASSALPRTGTINAGRRPTLSDQPPMNKVITIDGRAENMTIPR